MELRSYGATGLSVSPLAYGAMTVRSDPALKDGVAPSLLAALEAGVTLIDTARAYPDSEAIIAATLKVWGGPKPLISTKLRSRSREAYRVYRPAHEAYPAEAIRDSVEASLRALQVDALDIVHLHQWHYAWTHELGWLETLQRLREAGKLRSIAVSVQDHEHDAALELVSRGLVDGVQAIVHVFESRPANALLPLARTRGAGVIARCALDSGGLTGEFGEAEFAARTFLKHAPFGEYAARLAALREAFVPDVAGTLTELALRFVLSLPGVSSLALGMAERRFVDAALEAVRRGPLPAEAVDAIRREHVWTRNFYERLP
ncbi:aldo/keto reductase [Phenylobacterium terrae]|uniref:Aldo/keto reductase n=1 Tax=Phenylobacterium terrae TaxID=2665495 RepID=A0ABW4N6F0_9CAUL